MARWNSRKRKAVVGPFPSRVEDRRWLCRGRDAYSCDGPVPMQRVLKPGGGGVALVRRVSI